MLILICIICMSSYSYAAGAQLQAKIEITPNETKVSAGDKVTFTFITKNIVNSETGKIYSIGGKVVYDTNFFELDTTSGITLGSTGLFNSTNVVSEGGTNGSITLKVKEDATGSGDVEFSELVASDGRLEDMETLGMATTSNQKFTITIDSSTNDTDDGQTPPPGNTDDDETPSTGDTNGDETPSTGNTDGDETPSAGDTNNEQTSSTENTSQTQSDETTVSKDIPKAGISKILTIAMVVVLVITVGIYRKKQKYQDIY